MADSAADYTLPHLGRRSVLQKILIVVSIWIGSVVGKLFLMFEDALSEGLRGFTFLFVRHYVNGIHAGIIRFFGRSVDWRGSFLPFAKQRRCQIREINSHHAANRATVRSPF